MAENFVEDVTLLDGGALDTDYLGEYADAQTRRGTPPEGKYTLRMPEQFKYELTPDKKVLKILIDPAIIVGGEYDGTDVRFIRVSTKKFPRDNSSSAGDVLRNFGIDVSGLKTVQAWADAFGQIANQVTPSPVYCTWKAWDKETKTETKGMKNFPSDGNGGFLSAVSKKTDSGEEYRIYANLTPTARGFSPRM